MPQTMDLASSELVLRDGRQESLGYVPLVHRDWGGALGVGAPTVVVPSLEVVRMVGLPAGMIAAVVAVTLGRVGGKSYASG